MMISMTAMKMSEHVDAGLSLVKMSLINDLVTTADPADLVNDWLRTDLYNCLNSLGYN